MAASVNNIAATFSAARDLPSPSTGTTATSASSSSSSARTLSAAFSSAAAIPVRPISVSWNPHSALRRSQRSKLLGLYGLPGPRPRGLPAVLHSPPITAPAPPPATISVGNRLPDSTLSYIDGNGTVRIVSLSELTRGRKAVIMAVPGAFAPPSRTGWWYGGGGGGMSPEVLVRRAGEMREKAGDAAAVACVAVNDVYVMRAWGEQLGASEGGVMMLSDPDAELATALGLALDMRGGTEGFGVRCEGYCIVAVNGVVRALFLNNHRDGGDGSDSAPTAAAAGFDDVLRVL